MTILLYLLLTCTTAGKNEQVNTLQNEEIKIVHKLFRLRNEHKADSAEQYFADTVLVYMKYLRNVSKKRSRRATEAFGRPTRKINLK